MPKDEFNPYEFHDLESGQQASPVKPLEFEEGEITDREPRTPIELILTRKGFVSNETAVMIVHRNYCEVQGKNLDKPILIAREEALRRVKIGYNLKRIILRDDNNKRKNFLCEENRDLSLNLARLETWTENNRDQGADEEYQKVFLRMKKRIFYPAFNGMAMITAVCFTTTAVASGILCIDSSMPIMIRIFSACVYMIPFMFSLLLTVGLWRHQAWTLPVGFFLSLIPTILLAAASILIFPIIFFVIAVAVSWSFYKGWRDNDRLTEMLQRDNENRINESSQLYT